MVVAQLLKRCLSTREIFGSNPVIGNTFNCIKICIDKTKIKKKRHGMDQFKKIKLCKTLLSSSLNCALILSFKYLFLYIPFGQFSFNQFQLR